MVHVPGPGCQRLCSRCRCIPRRRWGRSQRDLNKMQVRVELFCVFLLPRGRHGGGEHRLLTGAKDAVFGEHAVWSFCPQFSAGAYTVGEGGTGTGLPGWLRVKINYFTSSDPHHDMSGGGCQVGVVRVNWKWYFPKSWQEPWRHPTHLFSGLLRALVVSCPPFSIATTSQLFLPHQLHHVVVHDMERALKPPKTRSVHNNPMSHVRKEPAKKIGRHFWSPIPLLLFPLQRKPKMTSLMFWGKFIISLFFPPFFLSFFWTSCRWFKLQTFPMGFHKGKVITDSHHREHDETPGWEKSNMKSLHHLFKCLVCIERTCFCMSDLFTAKTTITWSLYTPQKRSCKSETWSADDGFAPACQISCSSAWQVNKPKGCQRCQYGELRTGKPVLKTKSSS